MRVFLVFQKEDENYSTLPEGAEIITIFRRIKGNPHIGHIKQRLQKILDTADVNNDFIVYNGPSYLCALAGYIWMTQDGREKVNFFSYNKTTKRYHKHEESIHIDETTPSIDPDLESQS